MSYASAAAKNSQGGGAHASQEYLEGSHGITGSSQNEESPDVDSNKVNVVPAGTDLHHLETESHQEFEKAQAAAEEELKKLQQEASKAAEAAKREAHKAKKWAGEEGEKLTEDAKKAEKTLAKKAREVSAQVQAGWGELSSDPKAWGTLLGAVNVALLGGLGYYAYTERNNTHRWDRRVVSAISVGVLTLLGGQGYVAAETARKQQGKK